MHPLRPPFEYRIVGYDAATNRSHYPVADGAQIPLHKVDSLEPPVAVETVAGNFWSDVLWLCVAEGSFSETVSAVGAEKKGLEARIP